jgi:hypothetical protein
MNSIIHTQAEALQQLCHSTSNKNKHEMDINDLKAHIYLESMLIPVDVQDRILNAIHRLKSVSTGKIMVILEHCSLTDDSEKLLH